MSETVGQVHARVNGGTAGTPGVVSGENITSAGFAEIRAAFDQTSTGFVGIGNAQEAFLASIAETDSALAATLRNPNGDFSEYSRMRALSYSAQDSRFQIKNGREAQLGARAFEDLRALYNWSPDADSKAAFLSGLSGSSDALRAAIQDPSITYNAYRGQRATEQGASSAP